LTFLFANEHCWDADACASTIIRHDHFGYVFTAIIDDDSQGATSLFDVADFGYECAFATVYQEDRSQYAIRIAREVIGEVIARAAKLVGLIVVDATNLNRDD
jgi:hypothetical protein